MIMKRVFRLILKVLGGIWEGFFWRKAARGWGHTRTPPREFVRPTSRNVPCVPELSFFNSVVGCSSLSGGLGSPHMWLPEVLFPAKEKDPSVPSALYFCVATNFNNTNTSLLTSRPFCPLFHRLSLLGFRVFSASFHFLNSRFFFPWKRLSVSVAPQRI